MQKGFSLLFLILIAAFAIIGGTVIFIKFPTLSQSLPFLEQRKDCNSKIDYRLCQVLASPNNAKVLTSTKVKVVNNQTEVSIQLTSPEYILPELWGRELIRSSSGKVLQALINLDNLKDLAEDPNVVSISPAAKSLNIE